MPKRPDRSRQPAAPKARGLTLPPAADGNGPASVHAAAWALGVFLAAVIPFIPALRAGISEFDDSGVLLEVDGWRGLGSDNLAWMFSSTHMGHYQPLTWLSYAIEYTAFGMNAEVFHATNIAIHAFNAVLVLLLTRRILRLTQPALDSVAGSLWSSVGAILFAVHPLRVESVAWITERRDVLSLCFLLLAALAYLRAHTPREPRVTDLRWYVAAIAFLTASLLSKAWGMTFFVVLLVLDASLLARLPYPDRRNLRRWWATARPALVQKLPFATLGLAAAATAAYAQSSMPYTVRTLEDWGVFARLAQGCYGLLFYLWKTLWPFGLAPLYELPPAFEASDPRFIAGLILAPAAAIALWMVRSRLPGLVAAAVIYAVLLAPVLGVLQSGIQLVADRYSYIACIPWMIVLAAGAARWTGVSEAADRRPAGRGRTATATAGLAIVAVGLAALTGRQCLVWHDTLRLWEHVLAVGQDGPITRGNYGRQLESRGRPREAVEQYRIALSMNDRDGTNWLQYGNGLKAIGDHAGAERALTEAAGRMKDAWRAWTSLGIMQITALDRPADAIESFRRAVDNADRLDSRYRSTLPHLMLGTALLEVEQPAAARPYLEKAAANPLTKAAAEPLLRELRGG